MAVERNTSLPKFMDELIEIPIHLEWCWFGWIELSTCRPPAMSGVSPIPWTAIDQYAYRYNIVGDDFRFLVHVCRELDAELTEHVSKEQAKHQKQAPSNPQSRINVR